MFISTFEFLNFALKTQHSFFELISKLKPAYPDLLVQFSGCTHLANFLAMHAYPDLRFDHICNAPLRFVSPAAVNSTKHNRLSNGLYIRNVSQADAGEYTCRAMRITPTFSDSDQITILLRIQRKCRLTPPHSDALRLG